ncbi:MAG: OmpH family outer membrane protein [Chlorobi bacterium]|nr:OmpH family outer membrane protein [Chlorobiota bacterium]
MKKITLLTLVLVLVFSGMNAQKFKYGHIDGQAVYKMMPETQKADTLYAHFVKQLEDQIKNMQDEYNAKVKEYKANEATLSDIIKQTKADEINSLGKRIQKFQVSAQTEAGKKQKELYEPVKKKFDEALKAVAKKYGYKFIIDKNVLLYSDDADDVTKLVKTQLGIK